MDAEMAQYIVRYYGELMSKKEKLAYRHLQSPTCEPRLREMSLEVTWLVHGGMEKFVEETARRILH